MTRPSTHGRSAHRSHRASPGPPTIRLPLTPDAPRSLPASEPPPAETPDRFEALYRAAQAAAAARERQLALFAHDLRNPMNALTVSAEVLKRAPAASRDAQNALAVIGRQVARLSQLVDRHLFLPTQDGAPAVERSVRIVVIDDNTEANVGLQAMLELDGYEVWTASDGLGGLAMLLHHQPDVAIVDIGLPGLNGCEVARRARAAGYRGRLLALSGFGLPEDVQRSITAGFEAHLVKPLQLEQLNRLLPPT